MNIETDKLNVDALLKADLGDVVAVFKALEAQTTNPTLLAVIDKMSDAIYEIRRTWQRMTTEVETINRHAAELQQRIDAGYSIDPEWVANDARRLNDEQSTFKAQIAAYHVLTNILVAD